MDLYNDIATPVELTGVARAVLADHENTNGSLSLILPNITAPTRTVRFNTRGTGMAEAATFRSWDAEAAIGSSDQAGQDVTAELPPVSQKIRVSELDYVDSFAAQAPDAKKNIVVGRTAQVARAVSDAVEVIRGQALESGKIVFKERGLNMTVDFDRPSEFNATADALWSDDAADMFGHIVKANETFTTANGFAATKMLVSNQVMSRLARSESLRALLGTGTAVPPVASVDQVNAALAAFGLPQAVAYNRKVNKGTGAKPVIDPTKVIFTADTAGRTVFGPTAEAHEPAYGLAAGEAAGVVAGAYRTNDPIAVWVKAAASALALLESGTAALALKVL